MNPKERRFLPGPLTLFFCSGFAGLGYQIVWAKQFGAGIGHEYPATLAVITALMSGMALGALLFDRLPARLQCANSVYGWIELLIGFWGAIVAFISPSVNDAILRLVGAEPSPARHWTVAFIGVFLCVLPATAGMGATLPAIQRFVHNSAQRSWTGLLYGVNTAGAMFGALGAAFWIVPRVGLRDASLVFAAMNVGCGLVALLIARRSGARTFLSASKPGKERAQESPRSTLALRLFFTGLFGIGFETLMIRGLSHVLESTVYTFAVLLAVYLLGTAFGALIYQRFPNTSVNLLVSGLTLSCIFAAILLRWANPAYLNLRFGLGDTLAGVAIAEFLIGNLFFIIPAMFMGAIFSGLAETSLKTRATLGWSVAVNSIGSALAPPLFGFFILPAFGLKVGLALIVLGYATLASRAAVWLIPLAALLFPLFTAGKDLIAHRAGETIAFFREGTVASVAVLESTNQSRVLKVNNRFQMGGTAARIAEERHADIPLLLHAQPRRALFIGLGTGITFATAANYPGLVADGVELLPAVVEAMPLFQNNPELLKNPALNVHVADGRRFVQSTTNRYDVIVGDLFHPAQDGAAFLYTFEHFKAVSRCLAPNGLFCQWLPLYQMELATFDTIANTFSAVFPYAQMWLLRFNVDTPAIGLIGWHELPTLRSDWNFTSEALREHLRAVALGDPIRLYGCQFGDLAGSDTRDVNTDDHPIILFEAPFVTFRREDEPATRLLKLIERGSSSVPLFGRWPYDAPLASYIQARNIFLLGLIQEKKGDLSGAVERYIESSRASPDFTSAYAQSLGIASSVASRDPEAARKILLRLIDAQPERPVARQLLEKLNPR
jgi:spermidine synthase